MTSYTPNEWSNLIKQIYDLCNSDIESVSEEDIAQKYPKVIVMYEFFRLLRGEGFQNSRPAGLGEMQNEFYKMEDDLNKKMGDIKSRIDFEAHGGKAKYYLAQMTKSFEIQ